MLFQSTSRASCFATDTPQRRWSSRVAGAELLVRRYIVASSVIVFLTELFLPRCEFPSGQSW